MNTIGANPTFASGLLAEEVRAAQLGVDGPAIGAPVSHCHRPLVRVHDVADAHADEHRRRKGVVDCHHGAGIADLQAAVDGPRLARHEGVVLGGRRARGEVGAVWVRAVGVARVRRPALAARACRGRCPTERRARRTRPRRRPRGARSAAVAWALHLFLVGWRRRWARRRLGRRRRRRLRRRRGARLRRARGALLGVVPGRPHVGLVVAGVEVEVGLRARVRRRTTARPPPCRLAGTASCRGRAEGPRASPDAHWSSPQPPRAFVSLTPAAA